MRTSLLVVLLLAAGPALADEGRATFQRACARCHTATAPKKDGPPARSVKVEPGNAPDLTLVAGARTYKELEAWVSSPWTVRPETGCDTRLIRPHEKTDLLSYLVTLPRPRPPDAHTKLKRNLERSMATRDEVRRKDRRPPPPPGGHTGKTLPGARTGGGK